MIGASHTVHQYTQLYYRHVGHQKRVLCTPCVSRCSPPKHHYPRSKTLSTQTQRPVGLVLAETENLQLFQNKFPLKPYQSGCRVWKEMLKLINIYKRSIFANIIQQSLRDRWEFLESWMSLASDLKCFFKIPQPRLTKYQEQPAPGSPRHQEKSS